MKCKKTCINGQILASNNNKRSFDNLIDNDVIFVDNKTSKISKK